MGTHVVAEKVSTSIAPTSAEHWHGGFMKVPSWTLAPMFQWSSTDILE